MEPDFRIREAVAGDAPAMQAIERSAGELFRDIGMPEIADDAPLSLEQLTAAAVAGHAWVVVDTSDRAIGYALVLIVDGCAHIEQLSIARDHHRRGHGRRLIEHVAAWAGAHELTALTLTTFRDVPWNAPYYERCGFRPLGEDEVTPGLAALRDHESDAGLDPELRVCMHRRVR